MGEAIIDLNEVMERVQQDKELLLELLDIYQDDFIQKRKSLDEAISSKNTVKIKEIAHSMKGASGNISAKPMYAMCLKIEEYARNGKTDDIHELLAAVDGYFEEIKIFSAKYKEQNGG
jgi:HPt (histidine-containing phosphotransfer) domain-containing protein